MIKMTVTDKEILATEEGKLLGKIVILLPTNVNSILPSNLPSSVARISVSVTIILIIAIII